MPGYECILACHTTRQQRGRYWLRLYERPERVVAILAEVPGNSGPHLTEVITEVGLQVVQRFQLDPTRLILLDHYPPDTVDRTAGEYNLLLMEWHGNRFAAPRWLRQHALDVRDLVGEPVFVDRPFWQRARDAALYGCQVGKRRALVAPQGDGRWRASVSWSRALERQGEDLANQQQAQGWALDELAHAAAEFDLWRVRAR